MTRDEAIKICVDHTSALGEPYTHRTQLAQNMVGCLEALGLLKVEDPRDAETIFIDAVNEWRIDGSKSIVNLLAALRRAGVEPRLV